MPNMRNKIGGYICWQSHIYPHDKMTEYEIKILHRFAKKKIERSGMYNNQKNQLLHCLKFFVDIINVRLLKKHSEKTNGLMMWGLRDWKWGDFENK